MPRNHPAGPFVESYGEYIHRLAGAQIIALERLKQYPTDYKLIDFALDTAREIEKSALKTGYK